jgi:hypothetical protein
METMSWNQVYTIISVNVGLISALAALIVWIVTKVDTDVKNIGVRMDKMDSRHESHSARIDQLYKMFVELLQAKK